jgi:hypothetical protein
MTVDAVLLKAAPTCFLVETSRRADGTGAVTTMYAVGDGRRYLARSDAGGVRWYRLPDAETTGPRIED